MKLHSTALISLCLFPTLAFAQPTTQPKPRFGRGERMARPDVRRPEEMNVTWPEVEAFFKENSPKRYEAFTKLTAEQQEKSASSPPLRIMQHGR